MAIGSYMGGYLKVAHNNQWFFQTCNCISQKCKNPFQYIIMVLKVLETGQITFCKTTNSLPICH